MREKVDIIRGKCETALIDLTIRKNRFLERKKSVMGSLLTDEIGANTVEVIIGIAVFAAISLLVFNGIGDTIIEKGKEINKQILDSGTNFGN